MKVSNMTSHAGNTVPNQFIIEGLGAGSFWDDDGNSLRSGDAFQSYRTIIAYRDFMGKLYLDRDRWDYSVTTSRYRNQFLGMCTSKVKDKIANGEITLIDLNP